LIFPGHALVHLSGLILRVERPINPFSVKAIPFFYGRGGFIYGFGKPSAQHTEIPGIKDINAKR